MGLFLESLDGGLHGGRYYKQLTAPNGVIHSEDEGTETETRRAQREAERGGQQRR